MLLHHSCNSTPLWGDWQGWLGSSRHLCDERLTSYLFVDSSHSLISEGRNARKLSQPCACNSILWDIGNCMVRDPLPLSPPPPSPTWQPSPLSPPQKTGMTLRCLPVPRAAPRMRLLAHLLGKAISINHSRCCRGSSFAVCTSRRPGASTPNGPRFSTTAYQLQVYTRTVTDGAMSMRARGLC